MSRLLTCGVALLLAGITTPCWGQSTIMPPTLQPSAQPRTSPFLFLSQGGRTSAALSYYRQVRPQRNFFTESQQQARSLSALGEGVTQLQAQIQAQTLESERLQFGPTGHSTRFSNRGSYFGNPGNYFTGLPGGRTNRGRPGSR